jgi:predicted transcriptional regulator
MAIKKPLAPPISMNVRLDPAMRAALDKAAKADNRTLSSMVTKIIADWLKAQGGKK